MVEAATFQLAAGVAMRVDMHQADGAVTADRPQDRVADGMIAADAQRDHAGGYHAGKEGLDILNALARL